VLAAVYNKVISAYWYCITYHACLKSIHHIIHHISSYLDNKTKIPAVARVGPTVLVVTDLQGHPRSMIFISSEKAHATSY